MIIENVLEMRGRDREEFIKYFLSIGGVYDGSGKFTGPCWEVEVSPEGEVGLGLLKLPVTFITFRCSKEIMDRMVNSFRLKFLSAGG